MIQLNTYMHAHISIEAWEIKEISSSHRVATTGQKFRHFCHEGAHDKNINRRNFYLYMCSLHLRGL